MCPKFITPHHFECKNPTEGNIIPKQEWPHITQHILSKTFIWPQIVTCVTSAHNWPSTNFLLIWPVTVACDKITHTMSPNNLGQISLPRASMPLMTPFHNSQFHCSILMEIYQIIWYTFQMCPKIMTPHHFECKNPTEGNMIPKQKWSHMTQHILGKTFIWPQIITCVTSAHNWSSTNFLSIWPVTAVCDKIAHTMSPNNLGQISLPWASMPLMTPFHYSQFHCSILMEIGQVVWYTFSNVSKNYDPSPFWVQKSNRRKNDTQTKWSHMPWDILGKTFIWLQIMTCVTSVHNWPSTTFFPLWLNITKLLTQHPLMSWTKFHYHRHQCHLPPHFMTHIAIVKYKQK